VLDQGAAASHMGPLNWGGWPRIVLDPGPPTLRRNGRDGVKLCVALQNVSTGEGNITVGHVSRV
jgi:hypothetical protein